MKKPEEINYTPTGAAILVYPPKSEGEIILLAGSNVGLGSIVAKKGPNCHPDKIKVGDKVMFDCTVFPLNIDGVEFWQLQEHEVFGIVLNGGKVKQGDSTVFGPKDPTGHYNH